MNRAALRKMKHFPPADRQQGPSPAPDNPPRPVAISSARRHYVLWPLFPPPVSPPLEFTGTRNSGRLENKKPEKKKASEEKGANLALVAGRVSPGSAPEGGFQNNVLF